MNEQGNAASESPRVRRRWPKPPWHTRLCNWLYYAPRIWWTGDAKGISLDDGTRDCVVITTGRQAVWQLCRVPGGLLLFLYAVCCVISGRAVSAAVFRAFLAHVFNWKGGL